MISVRSPWQKAVTTDDCFCEFLLNENYLVEMLPISREANTLLRKILVYEPSQRIKLDALRKEIIELPTFFMSDEELACAGEVAREAAAFCGVRANPIKGESPAKKAAVSAASAPNQRAPVKPLRAPAPRLDVLPAPELDTTDATSSTVVSSGGPVTPTSYPVQADAYLPQCTGLIKDEVMPCAPRIRQSARAFAA